MAERKESAGILMFRRSPRLQVLLAHPGGPLWAAKDDGAWSIPKGEFVGEDPLEAAKREFLEETGKAPIGKFMELTPVVQRNGKRVHAWAIESDFDPKELKSNEFEMEWPPRSGRARFFPEVDRVEWFEPELAAQKVNLAQAAFIFELIQKLLRG